MPWLVLFSTLAGMQPFQIPGLGEQGLGSSRGLLAPVAELVRAGKPTSPLRFKCSSH